MGKGGAISPDTAVTLSVSKLAALLGVKPALLKDILGTTSVELRDQPKIVAGGIDAEREMGFWTFFNNIGSIPTSDVPRELYLKHIKRKCTNGGVNAGTQSVLIEPAENSVVTIFFAGIENGDTVDRAGAIAYNTSGNVQVGLLAYDGTLSAGIELLYPAGSATNFLEMRKKLIFSDAFEVKLSVASVAISQDSSYFMLYSYIGDAPTITEVGPAGSTFADVS